MDEPESKPEPDSGPGPKARNSYIARHWRGDLPLPTSYWINIVLASVLLMIGLNLLGPGLAAMTSIWAIAASSAFIFVTISLLTIWQLVGLWRSAGQVLARGGHRFWPVIARGLAMLGVIGSVQPLAQLTISTTEQLKIALGDGTFGQRTYEITQNGRELVIDGGISYGLVEEVQRKLENNPDVEIIHLQGPGGRIGPARRLRRIIEKRKLNTYVSGECHSACTMIFLGGNERVLRKGAKLGFHRISAAGLGEHEMEPENNVERRYMATKGIPHDFIEKVFATPPSSVWTPSHDTLLAAGYVSRITNGTDFGSQPVALAKVDQYEQRLLQHDPVCQIQKSNASCVWTR